MDEEKQYLSELELMTAAYGDDFHLIETCEVKGASFIVDLKVNDMNMKVRFNVPVCYPAQCLKFDIDGNITNCEKAKLMEILLELVKSTPDMGCMELLQLSADALDSGEFRSSVRSTVIPSCSVKQCSNISIGRFLIYFHHIMSNNKRRAILENASVLSLGGFSKHGYPGVCIIEGLLEDVLEFVRRIQQLRWKFMVVRGEEIEVLYSDGDANVDAVKIVNNARKLPAFVELESMSDAGAICKSCGLHDLFMTCMKK